MTTDKVIIIGGGMAGLVLANSLKNQGIPVQVFERDTEETAREQGWSIGLYFGIPAIKNSVTEEDFEVFPQETCVHKSDPTHSFAFVDGLTGERLFSMDQTMKQKAGVLTYRVNRRRLRRWLISSLGAEHVVWNKRFSSYSLLPAGGVEVTFEDGTQVKGSMLVGADGSNSKVCQQMLGADAFAKATVVSPLRVICGCCWVSQEEWDHIKTAYATQMMAFGVTDDKRHVAHFMSLNDTDFEGRPDRPLQLLWSVSRYDDHGDISVPTAKEDMHQMAKEWMKLGNFSTTIPTYSLIMGMEESDLATMASITVRERTPDRENLFGTADSADGRVTLVGDAAHAMTMFRGEGGNHAMCDGGSLGQHIGKAYRGEVSLKEAVQAYLEEMVPRTQEAVKVSHDASVMVHHTPQKMLELFKGFGKGYDIQRQKAMPLYKQ